MRREPRVVLLTANGRRHRYAGAAIAEWANLVGIVSEAKAPTVPNPTLSPRDRETVERHLAGRDVVEARLLGEPPALPAELVLQLPEGGVNRPEVVEWVRERQADVLVLFGTSIVKAPLLDLFAERIVNVHLGLSPYYRGSGTNFWPLVERKPECVGATIHLAAPQVDAGPILGQVRPEVEISDRAHQLGTKAIVAALAAVRWVLPRYLDGRLVPKQQRLAEGRVFRRAEFSPEAVCQMWKHFGTGMMAEYLGNVDARRGAYPIVSLDVQGADAQSD